MAHIMCTILAVHPIMANAIFVTVVPTEHKCHRLCTFISLHFTKLVMDRYWPLQSFLKGVMVSITKKPKKFLNT